MTPARLVLAFALSLLPWGLALASAGALAFEGWSSFGLVLLPWLALCGLPASPAAPASAPVDLGRPADANGGGAGGSRSRGPVPAPVPAPVVVAAALPALALAYVHDGAAVRIAAASGAALGGALLSLALLAAWSATAAAAARAGGRVRTGLRGLWLVLVPVASALELALSWAVPQDAAVSAIDPWGRLFAVANPVSWCVAWSRGAGLAAALSGRGACLLAVALVAWGVASGRARRRRAEEGSA